MKPLSVDKSILYLIKIWNQNNQTPIVDRDDHLTDLSTIRLNLNKKVMSKDLRADPSKLASLSSNKKKATFLVCSIAAIILQSNLNLTMKYTCRL